VTLPLVFRHGAAETVFTIAVLVWLVFEAVMRAIQRMRTAEPLCAHPRRGAAAHQGTGHRVRTVRGRAETARARGVVMAAEINRGQAGSPAGTGAGK